MPAGQVQLSQTPLLFIHAYWLSAAARWVNAGPLLPARMPIFYHSVIPSRLCGAFLAAMPAGVLSYYQPCLLVWCLTIAHAFWSGASLSVMPAGVLPHYRPCPLVWCLTRGHACWCYASLFAMPSGVEPQ